MDDQTLAGRLTNRPASRLIVQHTISVNSENNVRRKALCYTFKEVLIAYSYNCIARSKMAILCRSTTRDKNYLMTRRALMSFSLSWTKIHVNSSLKTFQERLQPFCDTQSVIDDDVTKDDGTAVSHYSSLTSLCHKAQERQSSTLKTLYSHIGSIEFLIHKYSVCRSDNVFSDKDFMLHHCVSRDTRTLYT